MVLQPTTHCNLDCSYCYLPHRLRRDAMSDEVVRAVAAAVEPWTRGPAPLDIVWHGGEPTAVGVDRLDALMAAFDGLRVRHGIQTNATLLDPAWCALFRRRDVRVGVSLDGRATDNAARVNLAGRPSWAATMRGIGHLVDAGVGYHALAVVADPDPGAAADVYAFFAGLPGCRAMGFSIVEQEGVRTAPVGVSRERARAWWRAVTHAWLADRSVRVRELDLALTYAGSVRDRRAGGTEPGSNLDPGDGGPGGAPPDRRGDAEAGAVAPRGGPGWTPGGPDPLPTVAHDGSVVLFSPELAGFSCDRYGDFSAGNVTHRPLPEIVADALASPTRWEADLRRGVAACRATCGYFDFCGGGTASNRWFELGDLTATETAHCRTTRKALLDGVLAAAADLRG
ncbi:radical SAM protein [Longispora sp. K20-0274]|uniref:radical SAM protein n=1 Tax=Longispora sp. K20-0274 TaxID=3088255 RepID=UPI00399B70C6